MVHPISLVLTPASQTDAVAVSANALYGAVPISVSVDTSSPAWDEFLLQNGLPLSTTEVPLHIVLGALVTEVYPGGSPG